MYTKYEMYESACACPVCFFTSDIISWQNLSKISSDGSFEK
jgi:hypothetical protein